MVLWNSPLLFWSFHPTTFQWFTRWDGTYTGCHKLMNSLLLSTTLRTPRRPDLSGQTVTLQVQTQSFPCRMQHTRGDSSITHCNDRAFWVCVVHGWTGAWWESILQQWQMQSTYFSHLVSLSQCKAPLTDWNYEQWKTALLSKATGSKTHILSKSELSLEERRYTSIFSWLLKTNRNTD